MNYDRYDLKVKYQTQLKSKEFKTTDNAERFRDTVRDIHRTPIELISKLIPLLDRMLAKYDSSDSLSAIDSPSSPSSESESTESDSDSFGEKQVARLPMGVAVNDSECPPPSR